MLADAGVDMIMFDCTNGDLTWPESYNALCEVFAEARKNGIRTPKIAFMLAFGPSEGSRQAIKDIYADLYKPGRHQDLWFRSVEHTSELQSLMRTSYAVFCLKKNITKSIRHVRY